MAEWLKAADCGLWFFETKPKLAAHISDYMMNIGLIRGNLNRKADGNPELGKKFLSVETLYLISSLEDKEKVQTTNIILIMVAKAIVVRNLFSFEYEGSNPSLPTTKYKETCILFLTTKQTNVLSEI